MHKQKCWMCKPENYPFLPTTEVSRLIDENESCYAIVPAEYLFRHHIMIVHKEHRDNFIDSTSSEVAEMGKMMSKWCRIFKLMKYDTVYTGCFSDSGHVHFHLYPFRFKDEKIYKGNALQWLASKEHLARENKFENLIKDKQSLKKYEATDKEIAKRIEMIKEVVEELLKYKNQLS